MIAEHCMILIVSKVIVDVVWNDFFTVNLWNREINGSTYFSIIRHFFWRIHVAERFNEYCLYWFLSRKKYSMLLGKYVCEICGDNLKSYF